MASALAFHVVQCLFCFYFYFVTWETLGNSLSLSQLLSLEAVWMLSPSQRSSALWCTSTAVAWSSAEPKDKNRGKKNSKFILTFYCTLPHSTVCNVVQFWWERCLRGTEDPAAWTQPKGWIFLFVCFVLLSFPQLAMAKVSRHSPPLSLWAKIHTGLTSRYGCTVAKWTPYHC